MNKLKNFRRVSIAELSDVHLGHRKTPTAHIISTLNRIFPNTPETHELDLIIIPGDLFDGPLEYNSQEVSDIEVWWLRFIKMCAEHSIILRISRGTPLHDRDQIDRLFGLIDGLDIGVDAKYFSDLAVERIPSLELDILYIPDEYRHHCDDTWVEVTKLLSSKGLTHVDIVAMHGAFHHQVPKNLHHAFELHNAERYLSICKGVVYVGHVHQMSNYKERILAAGSTDRLCHGDEGTKGHWRTIRREDGSYTHTFIPNPNALIYHSINVEKLNADNLYSVLDKAVAKFPAGSHVRLVGKAMDIGLQAINTLSLRHPDIIWTTKKITGDEEVDKPVLMEIRPIVKTINITSDNVVELMQQRLSSKYETAIVQTAIKKLEESLHD